ncbi:cell division protein ZapA [Chryseobacterium sp. WG14]|jgi:cell division protein ZapA|uniref:Cell division protein ZapA n=1 Tax=Chryseobacterium rhizosphaerae TaxID=395937 RepID=A0AAE3Y9E6_9FLAO|nr:MULTISPECIES: cell division protein ZapA [Chryseobacterium]MBL3546155.1 cell division protein ZapA [Chryseobacterium sp. KMC2]MCQ9636184.1 cell division protein ZapA [Chryseobacterium sp. WG23]MCQ9638441.1 cell division protein ZapA [Chryseobacterium sp. WG14]MDC8100910.1 cell division protein ZapA [Chryseobacterium rhizosphaerae]MDR6525941.1 cell division protein ZapA [Chryseobacterium rhizosphaerae]
MEVRRITVNIAGRVYPLNVPAAEEETLRKVGKQIENMIKDFEQNFDVRDKQDALAMCALKLGTNAEVVSVNYEKNINSTNERLAQINQSLNEIGK